MNQVAVQISVANISSGSIWLNVEDTNGAVVERGISLDAALRKLGREWRLFGTADYPEVIVEGDGATMGFMRDLGDDLKAITKKIALLREERASTTDGDRYDALLSRDGELRVAEDRAKVQQLVIRVLINRAFGFWPSEARDYNL